VLLSSLAWLSKITDKDVVPRLKALPFNRSKNDRGRDKEADRLIRRKRLYKRKKFGRQAGKEKKREGN